MGTLPPVAAFDRYLRQGKEWADVASKSAVTLHPAPPVEDQEGLERHAAMASYAVCETTVPKIVLHVGRCFNNGQMAMGTRLMGADAVMAWPTADIRFADFDESLEAVYGKGKEDIDQADIERFSRRYFDSPKCPASLLMVDDIINPKDTRSVLIDTLGIVEKKAVTRPEKKHGNLPL